MDTQLDSVVDDSLGGEKGVPASNNSVNDDKSNSSQDTSSGKRVDSANNSSKKHILTLVVNTRVAGKPLWGQGYATNKNSGAAQEAIDFLDADFYHSSCRDTTFWVRELIRKERAISVSSYEILMLVIPPGEHLFSNEQFSAIFPSTHCFDKVGLVWVDEQGAGFATGKLSDEKELRFSTRNYTHLLKFKELNISNCPPLFKASSRVLDYPQLSEPSDSVRTCFTLSDETSHVHMGHSDLRILRIYIRNLSNLQKISWNHVLMESFDFIIACDDLKELENNFKGPTFRAHSQSIDYTLRIDKDFNRPETDTNRRMGRLLIQWDSSVTNLGASLEFGKKIRGGITYTYPLPTPTPRSVTPPKTNKSSCF